VSDIDDFVHGYAPRMAATVERLRVVVQRAVPQSVERLRPGWRLIGYDVPNGRRLVYFAWIWPQPEHNHVHVGWQTGTLMRDPDGLLQGADLKLKKVRYLTFDPGERVAAKVVADFSREAARIVLLSRGERELMAAARQDAAADR
jgi:hypothetical protein